MTQPPPEDFAADAEVDDSTRLAARRVAPAQPDAEADDSTQLATRRAAQADAEAEDSTQLATRRPTQPDSEPDSQPEDATQLASRRSPGSPNDSTVLSSRHADSASATLAGVETQQAPLAPPRPTRTLPDLPPDFATGDGGVGPRARAGGFGTTTEAYTPRSVAPPGFVLPPASSTSTAPEHRDHVLTPADAQRKRDAAHRSAVGKAFAVGIAVLVIGTAAVIGILLLVRALL